MKNVDPHDKVGIAISNDSYIKPVLTSVPEKKTQLTVEVIQIEVEKAAQRNENFSLNKPLRIKIAPVSVPVRQIRKTNLYLIPFDKFCSEYFKSVVTIKNKDEFAYPRLLLQVQLKLNTKYMKQRTMILEHLNVHIITEVHKRQLS